MANSEFLTHHSEFTAPGWERDENGALRRVKKPHMGRRLPGFDYSQRRIYEITIVLKERRPVLGRLVKKPYGSAALEDGAGNEPTWVVEPSALGQAALDCWRKITDFWPQVSLIEAQLMPEHFHGILFVKEHLPLTYPDRPEGPGNRRKALGDIIRGFKVGCTMAWREIAANMRQGRETAVNMRQGGKTAAKCGRAERLNGQKDSWIPFFFTRASLRR